MFPGILVLMMAEADARRHSAFLVPGRGQDYNAKYRAVLTRWMTKAVFTCSLETAPHTCRKQCRN